VDAIDVRGCVDGLLKVNLEWSIDGERKGEKTVKESSNKYTEQESRYVKCDSMKEWCQWHKEDY